LSASGIARARRIDGCDLVATRIGVDESISPRVDTVAVELGHALKHGLDRVAASRGYRVLIG
jgi:hypothetical protein